VNDKQSIAILGTASVFSYVFVTLADVGGAGCCTGKDVAVLKEVHVRSCIVLPSKVLSKSAKNEVLL